ncbi:MAG: DUF3842 family protein, partial [Clostridia bacterium]|nr:DUF3842 family protein [Clostridia bacterium]
KIAVLDAQGAGIGKTVIKSLRDHFGDRIKIYALGTNKTATSNMLAAGADFGLTGEERIIKKISKNTFDCLIGPIGIIASGGIQGEITPDISKCIFEATCRKYIIPLNLHNIFIPGTTDMKIQQSINFIIDDLKLVFRTS